MFSFHQLPIKNRRWLLASLLLVILVVNGLGFFAGAKPVIAQPGVPQVTVDIPQTVSNVWDKIKDAVWEALKRGAAVAYKNAIRTFTQRVAYDMAVYVSSGGKGQKPMFVTQPMGKYLKNVAGDAAGDFLDTFAKESGFLKHGLCQPIDLRTQLTITMPLFNMPLFNEIKPRKPVCNLKAIQTNLKKSWEQAQDYYSDLSLKNYQQFFDTSQNDLGIAVSMLGRSVEETMDKKEVAKLKSSIGQGFLDLASPISDNIKTPAQAIGKSATSIIPTASLPEGFTGEIIADSLNIFTNTLIARLQKRFFQQGLSPTGGGTGGPSSVFGPGGGTVGIEYAIQVNTSISTPNLITDAGQQLDIVSELLNCPDLRYASVNNCTITQGLATALRQAEEGQALTLKEAIAKGYLEASWKFAGIRPLDTRRPDAWYLSDLRKLRKARIIPVGWELAAEKFPGKTLNEVMNGFNVPDNPDTDINEGQYLHLIDPDWVLRAPPSQCRVSAAGQILQPQGPNRQDTCVDTEQCVAEKDDGSCAAWGYCLAEKNTWRFWGDSCESPVGSGRAPYATCQAFTDKNGKELTLLTNSLNNYNDEVCNASSAGCRWYSIKPLNTDTVTGLDRYSQTETDRWYLKNLDKLSCTVMEQGCTAFWRATNINDTELMSKVPAPAGNTPVEHLVNWVTASANTDEQYTNYASLNKVYLREAPAHLNCYDVDGAGEPILDNNSPQCQNYAARCSSREVGCESYTPADGAPAVPAVITSQDYCPDVCVGFNRYTQGWAFFEQTPTANFDFISKTAKTCPAQSAGCEEFTNLDQSTAQGEKREYYSELRQCIAADDPGAGTFYTWVGSDLPGFQLKPWQLKTAAGGGPYTVDNSAASTACGDGDADGDGLPDHTDFPSNPDCKQFYSLTGDIFYRYLSKTVSAAATCYRYRATNITQVDCGVTNGDWDNTLKACLYRAIPGEGKSCAAKDNGCREYRGPTSAASQLLFPVSTFGDAEAIGNYPLDTSFTSGWTSGQNTKDSLSVTGRSYASGTTPTITRVIPAGTAKAGHKYLFTFWAKRYTTNNNLPITTAPAGSHNWNLDLTTIGLSDDWREYRIESLLPADAATANTLNTTGAFLSLSAAYPFVIDNVVARDVSDTFYLVKNSWQTPAVCESPRFLGCQSYTSSKKQQVFVTGFSSLCRQEAVGCEALINTQNSDSPREQTLVSGAQTITVPADNLVYRVYDQSKSCAASAEACRLIGQPNLDANGLLAGWGDKLVKLDPDQLNPKNNFNSPLCDRSQNGCDQFTSSTGSHYFKDPGQALCEYRQSDGKWYKSGSGELCNVINNPSFEEQKDYGNNLLTNPGFEDGVLGNWRPMPNVNAWSITTKQAYLGSQSIKLADANLTGGVLQQTIRALPKQTYTVRVWTKADNTTNRSLRVFGCGVNLSDSSQNAGVWEKLQITYQPTTSACTVELQAAAGSSEVYFDNASVFLAEDFPGWRRNGHSPILGNALTTLSATDSIPGRYWESKVLEIESTDQQYSGVWSDWIDVGLKNQERYFTVSANLYVPDIPQNANMLYWRVSHHAVPETYCDSTYNGIRPNCHHYNLVSGSDADSRVDLSDKGKWVHVQSVIKAAANVRYVSVGVITNEAGVGGCTAAACRANQVVYVDQVSITEGVVDPAYTCPEGAKGCTAYRDPQLTQNFYYYLDNGKLDKTSCNGQVSEKSGCLLFTDYNNANLKWSANATYADSNKQGGIMISPQTTGNLDTNTILKVGRSRVCSEWITCQSSAVTFGADGKSRSVCYALGRCNKTGGIASSKCSSWKTISNPEPLKLASYQSRNVDFASPDLSGYSILHQYPLDTLLQKNYSTDRAKEDIRLTYLNTMPKACASLAPPAPPSSDAGKACTVPSDCSSNSCLSTLRCGGTGNLCDHLGQTCADNTTCFYADFGINGQGPGEKNTLAKICRVYPAPDAPFPSQLAVFNPNDVSGDIKSREAGFKDANICQPGEDCECNYKSVKYSLGEQRFYSFNNENIPNPIVVDKTKDNPEGSKSYKKQEDLFMGLRGYCLETDDSRAINGRRGRACLTWLPLDVLSGEASIYDYAPQAGYTDGQAHYCSSGKGNVINGKYTIEASQNSAYHIEYLYNSGYGCRLSGITGNYVIGGCSKHPWGGDNGLSQKCGFHDSGGFSCEDANGITHDLNTYNNGHGNNPRAGEVAGFLFYQIPEEANEANLKFEDIAGIEVTTNSGEGWYGFTLDKLNQYSINDGRQSSTISTDYRPGFITWRYRNERGEGYQHVIYMDFVFDAKNQKLKGYGLGTDDVTGHGNEGVAYNISFILQDYCLETVKVASSSENKAWTDRVLRGSGFKAVPGALDLGFSINRSPSPYGRITTQPGNNLLLLSDKADLFISPGSHGQFTTITTPFGCEGNCGNVSPNKQGICISGTVNSSSTLGTSCNHSAECADATPSNQGICTGYMYSVCERGSNEGKLCTKHADCGSEVSCVSINKKMNPTGLEVGRRRVQELFAKIYDSSSYINGRYVSANTVSDISLSDEGSLDSKNGGVPHRPNVKEVKFDANERKNYEGNTGFTLSSDFGSITSSSGQSLSLTSPVAVTAKFYAYNANGEQMPLTEVRVDWLGNYQTAAGAKGKYKNHKHMCQSEKFLDNSNNPLYNFGDSPNACVDDRVESMGYFNFTKVFTCSADGAGLPLCSAVSGNKACWDQTLQACVYKPRVYVEDNWEWCATAQKGSSCDPENDAAWLTMFAGGKIIVSP